MKTTEMPAHQIEALARLILPEIQKYFESDEGKQEFESWMTEQQAKAKCN